MVDLSIPPIKSGSDPLRRSLGARVYYSAWLILEGNRTGWVPLIVGTLFVRVVFEVLILFFKIFEKLSSIHAAIEADGLGSPAWHR